MFGDFSRFENDPEIGLNGIYLSQGSPILDSDWNEQVAALTDWITVVGHFVTKGALQIEGFAITRGENSISVGPGKALLDGRIAQSQSIFKGEIKEKHLIGPHMFSDELPNDHKNCSAYMSLVSRFLPSRRAMQSGNRSMESDAVVEVTDWAVYVTNISIQNVRTVGDGQSLIPRIQIQTDSQLPDWASVCVIECHWTDQIHNWFKVSNSPDNILDLGTCKLKELKTDEPINVGQGACRMLELTADTVLFAEYEDDQTAHMRSVKALRPTDQPVNLQDVPQLFKVNVERTSTGITLKPVDFSNSMAINPALRPCLRLWNRELKDMTGLVKGVSIIANHGQAMVAGDRWYVPVENGKVAIKTETQVAGHRLFRGIASIPNATGLWGASSSTATNPAAALAMASSIGIDSFADTDSLEDRHLVGNTRSHLQPVAHRLDDSLHRLTGALNAARALTRQTPCKELKTRVSYLPLRRWLASTYVHEIVDHDLEAFLAKVRRSVDVAEEDEHRFREQAALILEEANQLAGRIPSGAESASRPQDMV